MRTQKQVGRFESAPDVCGGAVCLAGTRIPVWLIECFRRCGVTDLWILYSYPVLEVQDLEAAWQYVASNQDEINLAISKHDEEQREMIARMRPKRGRRIRAEE